MRSLWLYALSAAYLAVFAGAQQPAAPLADAGNSTAVEVLRLDDVVREALDKSPEVESARHSIEALKHRVPQAQALPDPSVSVGWAGNAAPFSIMARDASSYRGLAVSEQFPAPGKLKLQGAIAAKDVEAAQAALEGLRRRIAAEVQAAYYDYFFYGKALESAHRNQRLLEEVEQIAEAQYRAGKVEQPDVLRAQVEISLLLEKTVLLEQQRSMAEARLDSFLLRSPDEPLPPADEVHPDPLPVSLPQIYDMAAENDADAQGDSRTIERNRLSVALAQRQFRPDVGVSTMFQQRSDQAAMYGLTFSVNLPVFYKAKQRQAIVAATEEVIGAEKTRDGRLNQLRLELRQQLIAATTANKLMALYTKGVIPQTSLALESSMAAYQAAKTEIQPVLANMTTLLDYESDYYRQLADYQTALARIASLTGKEK